MFGTTFTNIFSHVDADGVPRILGETISHTGYIIMIFQIFVSRIFEKYNAMLTFLIGMFIAVVGFLLLGFAKTAAPAWVLLGIFLFAIGEMISSPRIQEYITWIAPKEKAGLYMGSNFLAIGIGAFSGLIYTPLYGYFRDMNHPEYVWYVIAANLFVGMIVINIFTKSVGEFKELDE
jgi:MFS family permease